MKKAANAKFGGNNEEYYGIFEKGLLTINRVAKPRVRLFCSFKEDGFEA